MLRAFAEAEGPLIKAEQQLRVGDRVVVNVVTQRIDVAELRESLSLHLLSAQAQQLISLGDAAVNKAASGDEEVDMELV